MLNKLGTETNIAEAKDINHTVVDGGIAISRGQEEKPVRGQDNQYPGVVAVVVLFCYRIGDLIQSN